jgi:hypothetical protein
MTIEPSHLLSFAFAFAMIVIGLVVLAKLFGVKWLMSLFESEDKPSLRLVMAGVVVVFALFMIAANRITDNQLEALLFFSGACFGFGTTKLIATRFAARPPVPTATIKADTAQVNADTATITPTTPA